MWRSLVADKKESFAVGGQAVIEGVMMRGRDFVACAVRNPKGEIVLKKEPFRSFLVRFKLNKVPIVRGAIGLIETMYLGMRILTYSAEIAMPEEERDRSEKGQLKEKIGMGLTIVLAFALGLGLFFYLPLMLTHWTPGTEGSLIFNLVDGVFRLVIFVLYIWAISMMKDMRRVFEYHGAEHKTINCFESGAMLTPETINEHSRFHPRCGTSFLMLVMVVSIVVFIPLGRPETIPDRLQRMAFIPLIGGISYELIKLSAKAKFRRLMMPIIAPGLLLQRLTTREPDVEQCEVSLRALAACLDPAELAERVPTDEVDFSPPPVHYDDGAGTDDDAPLEEAGT
ncbi:MAG: DUF1385 domain-containing protein [bacterium]|nr:DUF1385 domain-containing protein [bacterium]